MTKAPCIGEEDYAVMQATQPMASTVPSPGEGVVQEVSQEDIKCQQTDLVEFWAACGGRSGTQRYGPTGQPPHRRT